MATVRSKAEVAVKKYFIDELMDDRLRGLRHCALFDLHFGPYDADYYSDSADFENWPGYVKAVEELEEWADIHLVPVWFDMQTETIHTKEPQGDTVDGTWIEPLWEDWICFDKRAVYLVIFDKLVTHGGMS